MVEAVRHDEIPHRRRSPARPRPRRSTGFQYPAPGLRAGEDALPVFRHVGRDVHGNRRPPSRPSDDAAARGPGPARPGDDEGPHHVNLAPVYVHVTRRTYP